MKNLFLKLFLFTAFICAFGANQANAQSFRDARVRYGSSVPVSCLGTRYDSLFVVPSGAGEGLYTCVNGIYTKTGTGTGATSLPPERLTLTRRKILRNFTPKKIKY